jgi:NHLM bacteriocin system ABC transporter ATP-binding protein
VSSWFDEQIRQRIRTDDEMLSDAVARMANLVSYEKIATGFADTGKLSEEAVGDILRYYHVKAQELPGDIKGMDEVLEYLLRPSGIMRRPVKLSPGWHKEAIGAMLGTKKDGSIVAILPGSMGGYYVKDYTTGSTVRVTGAYEKEIDENAIAFYKPLPLQPLKFTDLVKYIFSLLGAGDYAMIIGATALVTILGLFVPRITKFLYGDVLQYGRVALLAVAIMTLLCLNLSINVINVIQSIINANINTKTTLSVESAMMMRVLSLPVNFFRDYSSGDLSNRIWSANSLCDMLLNAIFSTGLTAVFSLVYIGQIFRYAPALVTPVMTVTVATFVISVITALWQMRISEEQMKESSKESGLVYSLLGGVNKIKNAGAEKRAFAKWSEQYVKAAQYLYQPPMLLRMSPAITTGVTLIGTVVLYYEALRSHVSVSDYMAFNASYAMVNGAFLTLSTIATVVSQIEPTLKMIKPILDAEPEVNGNRPVVTKLSGAIELNNVSFRYKDDMPNVLDNLSLKIRPGQYVAIVGKTGCGKSTLMRILLGFEKPQKGAVYYDGKDISGLDLKSLRRHIGVVMQNSGLFQGDIYSNIVISAPLLTLNDAWEAAEMAGMAEDIRRMPMGMNTIISEGQGGISGGQRQRIMIARAIAPRPKILMFDEATSALDNITQKTVSDSLESLKCTRIVIAHRLSTIRHCDRIIVLQDGKIAEDGTYDELIAKNGYFAELVERQRVDVH